MHTPEQRVAVVLPVRGEHALLAEAVACLAAQRTDGIHLEVVVVDDDPERSARVPDGVRLLHSGGRGPYAARNSGWRAVDADLVLFCDVRSRPRPEWVQRTVAAFDGDDVAMVGSEVEVLGGRRWGARASAEQQIFRLSKYVARPGYLPYLPNCNMAVRRSDLQDVDGYPELRSGGDADLGWRVLARPGRRLVTIDDVLMDWVPRQGFREYLGQNYRYGRSHVALRAQWGGQGAPPSGPAWSRLRLAKRTARVVLRVLRGGVTRRGLDDALTQAGYLAFQAGVAHETRKDG